MCRLLTLLILIFSVHVYAEPVSLNNSPIRSFVQWYSEKTGRAVIINPDVKGNITVFNADVNQDNVDNFFKSVLNANGFIMIAGDPAKAFYGCGDLLSGMASSREYIYRFA
ncbi:MULTISPECIES: hypothetical protein [Pectobacterium]|uniref:hypothetical protein n=1 Tax=Pectobacterium TaxID=122277 RepID=UPI001E61B498|nr:hypothetical protein [Pectobacterium carotovorum]